jgi:hypothetical protein
MHAPEPTSTSPRVLVFDSGLGGLTVLREIVRARRDAAVTFVADDAFFPYGAHEEPTLIGRVVPLIGSLIDEHTPDLVVIACNTASTIVLPHLRERYRVSLRRHGPGDQAGVRGLQEQAGLGARHAGDGEARIYEGPDPRLRPRL